MWLLGAGCLAAALCVPASADTPNTGTKHKQVKHPETESHKAEAKANTAVAKSSHPETKSVSGPETERHSAHSATSHKKAHAAGTGSHHGKKKPVSSRRGQQKIDTDRTRQIQEALIRDHYMQGEASGKWDDSTEAALRKMQADNGWQNKTVPDSRALIKLGLGPNQEHLLNPDSAMTSAPEAVRANPISPNATGSSSPNQQ
jgi:hypothetical protein